MSLADIVKTTPHDLVYLNSFFSPTFTIKPLILRRMGILPERPFLLAPRGEFSKRALRLKRKKKALYLALSRNLGLYRDVAWQASSLYELNDIKTQLGIRDGKCFIAPDLGPVGTLYEESGVKDMHTPSHKKAQHLKVLFLSRISPMKNLDYALQVLAGVRVPLEFNIYGPIRDPAYWHYCKGLIKKLPNHIKVQYRGSVPHQQVRKIMKSHDLFFLPTRGENYGHVIPEALVAGTPVLIANTTPWRKLDRAGVGWDLPLSSKDVFISKIEEFAGMETSQFKEYRQRAKNFALKILADPKVVEANRRMLLTIISG